MKDEQTDGIDGIGDNDNHEAQTTSKPTDNKPRRKSPGPVQTLFWWATGGNADLLMHDSVRLDRARFSAMGAAVLTTAILAAFNAAVVSYNFLTSGSLVIALIAGCAWGVIILGLDRLMLVTLRKGSDGRSNANFWVVLPRVGLALLVAAAISIPAELVLFGNQLGVQVAVDQENGIAAQQQRLDRRFQEIDVLRARRGALLGQVGDTDRQVADAFSAAACEGDGTCGSHKRGAGILHDEKLRRYEELKQAATRTRAEVNPEVREIDARLDQLQRQRDQNLGRFENASDTSDDILGRLIALKHLEQDPVHGGTVSFTAWMIRLLSVCLELLPLAAKLSSLSGPYDAAFEAIQAGEAAHWHAVQENAVDRASVAAEQERMIGDAVISMTGQIIKSANKDAMNSPKYRQAQRDLSARILKRSVAAARRAAASVFDDRKLHDDVVAASTAYRRQADARVAEAYANKVRAVHDLDMATATAESLRETEAPFDFTDRDAA